MARRFVEVCYPRSFNEDDVEPTRENLLGNATTPQTYTFMTYLDDELKRGDYGVVACGADNGLKIVRVLQVYDHEEDVIGLIHGTPIKPFVAKLDLTTHFEHIRKQKRTKELKRTLDMRFKELEEARKYEILLQLDPTMGVLINEFRENMGIPALPAPSKE